MTFSTKTVSIQAWSTKARVLGALMLVAAWNPATAASAAAMPVTIAPATSAPVLAQSTGSEPGATTHVGTLTVQRHGDHGRPLILIPGLGGGPWVWQQIVPPLAKNHVVYSVTLAGFDGTPAPAGGNYLAQAQTSLATLIRQQHLVKPVLIGHSLGATLALELAAKQSALLGGVVAVDGLPVFPMTENLHAAQRTSMAEAIQAKMAAATPAEFAAQQLAYMRSIGVIDPALAEKYAPLNARSDAATTAQYAAEDMALDFRAQMKDAHVPILEISPYYAPDGAASPRPFSEAQKTAYWKRLLGPAPDARVVSISPSRHFVMLDQPAKFQHVLDDFLKSL